MCGDQLAYVAVIRLADEDDEVPCGPTAFAGLIVRSPAMVRVFRLVEMLEQSESTVLLMGESGTGKEVVARALHAHSPRRNDPFVAVNCAALPLALLESELFGHVRGAFTGAVRDRQGRFELAAGGTLFLDEVGDLPLPLQAKLLRVLQDRVFERLGDSHPRRADVRIIAATNVDLRRARAAGTFREDLYYRLAVVPIVLPPLRARREDIEPLGRALLGRVSARTGRSLRLSPDALRVMLEYLWPGNVRELENALEYASAVCRGQTVMPEDLPVEVREGAAEREALIAEVAEMADAASIGDGGAVADGANGVEGTDGTELRSGGGVDRAARGGVGAEATGDEDEERERIRATLEAHRWSRADAARALGMSRTTLWRKMRELRMVR